VPARRLSSSYRPLLRNPSRTRSGRKKRSYAAGLDRAPLFHSRSPYYPGTPLLNTGSAFVPSSRIRDVPPLPHANPQYTEAASPSLIAEGIPDEVLRVRRRGPSAYHQLLPVFARPAPVLATWLLQHPSALGVGDLSLGRDGCFPPSVITPDPAPPSALAALTALPRRRRSQAIAPTEAITRESPGHGTTSLAAFAGGVPVARSFG